MAVKVAINGFGRIGRNILRAVVESGRTDLEIVAINDLGPSEVNAHLLEFDSIHGRFTKDIKTTKNSIIIGEMEIEVTAIKHPAELPWKHIDIAMECTGIFTDREKAATHLSNGSSRVLISAPAKNADKTIVYGVNHGTLTKNDLIVSNASCTTNCLAPIAKVLHEVVGIKRGFMTTIHSYTGDQPVLDTMHNDLYRARAASLSMIPTTTGAAKAVALVYPAMKGKLTGIAMRVPTPNVSAVDLVFESSRKTSAEEVNSLLKTASQSDMKGIIKYGDLPLVSTDYAGTNESTIVDEALTMCIDDNMVNVLAWYDNEWGYSQRVVDLAEIVAKKWK